MRLKLPDSEVVGYGKVAPELAAVLRTPSVRATPPVGSSAGLEPTVSVPVGQVTTHKAPMAKLPAGGVDNTAKRCAEPNADDVDCENFAHVQRCRTHTRDCSASNQRNLHRFVTTASAVALAV